MLHGHGDNAYQYPVPIQANFSSNVYYSGSPQGLKEAMLERWDQAIACYPEVIGESLQNKLARHHNIEPDQILVTNGAVEAIYLIAQVFSGSRTAIFSPTFSEYEDACRNFNHRLSFPEHVLLQQKELPEFKADLCFLCNPNNPTGAVIPKSRVVELCECNKKTVFVVDEAFIDFTLHPEESLISELHSIENLIVLRSMTKLFAIPGLRLGYAVSSKAIIQKLLSRKQPWSVNALALTAGEFIIDNHPETLPDIPKLLHEARAFQQQLNSIAGLSVQESATHFMLCELHNTSAKQLQHDLAHSNGLLIRDASNFRGCHAGHFRVATLSTSQNSLLINALLEWLKK